MKRKEFRWSIGMLSAIVGTAAMLLSACGAMGGVPSIAVDPKKIDKGSIKIDTPETIRIKVTNVGSGALRFAEAPSIEVLEGC